MLPLLVSRWNLLKPSSLYFVIYGVSETTDVQFVNEDDLTGILKVVQARKLVAYWKSLGYVLKQFALQQWRRNEINIAGTARSTEARSPKGFLGRGRKTHPHQLGVSGAL